MHPVLFEVGGIPINTFGVMVAIGVMIASTVFRKRVSVYGISPEKAWDLCFWLIIFGTLGARLMYVLLDLGYFLKHPDELLTLRFAGLTSYGAFVTGLPTIFYWSRKNKISFVNLLDAITVPFLVGHTLGRIGCFFNGCCYGRYAENPSWGVTLNSVDHLSHYPIQIYESLLTLLSVLIILFLERRQILKPKQPFYLGLISYSVIRFILEIWRQGPGGTSTPDVSIYSFTQIVSIILIIIFIGLFLRAGHRTNHIAKNNEIL